jgi:2-methylcitrate dehydratase PrpD
VVLDPGCDAAFPGARSAIVTIELADGRTLRHHQTTRHGDPDDPLTDAELTDKFHELATPAIGRAAAETLLAQLWRIDQLPDTRLAPVTLARAAE